MATKLPHLQIKINKDLDRAVRVKHNTAKERQKSYADEKRRAKVKDIKAGDQTFLQQKKSSVRPPWDHQPYTVVDVQGSKVQAR